MVTITAEIVLKAYAAGIFPMSEGRGDQHMFWVDPEMRGVLPLADFHLPRRLRRTVRSEKFEVRIDTAFAQVIDCCASPAPGRWNTWINREINDLFLDLHERGYAHCVECWHQGELAGGLYGLALGAAFFGESMFSQQTDASKVALVHLVGRLRRAGFSLLDSQFMTDHLQQFGGKEIARADYHQKLAAALDQLPDFTLGGASLSAAEVLQSITQTS